MKRRPEFMPGSDFFERLRTPSGPTAARTLVIGPIAARLEDIPAHLVRPLEDHFQGFIQSEQAPGELGLSVRRAGVPSFLDPHGDVRRTCVQRAEGGRVLVYGHHFGAWFERDGNTGGIALCRAGWAGLRVSLEIFLRVYSAWRAIGAGGFLLHAASIVRGGRAFVFFGHSGAGKSTLSRFSRDAGVVLSDDISLITREGVGYSAHSVPFRAFDKDRVVSERRSYPLAGMYQLVQARHNRVEPLTAARGVAAVLSCLPFVTERLLPIDPAQTIRMLEGVAREVPVFRLEFTRSAEFWEPVLASVG